MKLLLLVFLLLGSLCLKAQFIVSKAETQKSIYEPSREKFKDREKIDTITGIINPGKVKGTAIVRYRYNAYTMSDSTVLKIYTPRKSYDVKKYKLNKQ